MLGHRILPCYQRFDWVFLMVYLSKVIRIAWNNFSKTSETGVEMSAFALASLKWWPTHSLGANVDGPDQKLILKAKSIFTTTQLII